MSQNKDPYKFCTHTVYMSLRWGKSKFYVGRTLLPLILILLSPLQ